MNQVSDQLNNVSSFLNKNLGLISLVGLTIIILMLIWRCGQCNEKFANVAVSQDKPRITYMNNSTETVTHLTKKTVTNSNSVIKSVFLPRFWGVTIFYNKKLPNTTRTMEAYEIIQPTISYRELPLTKYTNVTSYSFFIQADKVREFQNMEATLVKKQAADKLAADKAAAEKAAADKAAAERAAIIKAAADKLAAAQTNNVAVPTLPPGELFKRENRNKYSGPTLMLEDNGYLYYKTTDAKSVKNPNTTITSTRLLTLPYRVWRGNGYDPVHEFKVFNLNQAKYLLIPDNFGQQMYLYPEENLRGPISKYRKGYQGTVPAFKSFKVDV